MSHSTTTEAAAGALQDYYVTGLRNAYAMETQAIELISRQLDRLANYPDMEARLRHHLDESEEQRRRLETLLQQMNETHSAVKSAAMGLLGNLAALGHTPAPDEVVKNTLANFAFEHYEIAAYTSLISLANALGQPAAVAALRQSLKEEEEMATWVNAHIGPTTLAFVERRAAGEKADR